jgi:hypothetical protein
MLDECAIPQPAEPIPNSPDGHDYRRLARQIRDIARHTRLPIARNELLALPRITTGAAITWTGRFN